MAVRPQDPERERSPDRDRLWGLTQTVPTAPVATQPTLQLLTAPPIVPAGSTDGWVPARAADRLAPDRGLPACEADTAACEADAPACEAGSSGGDVDTSARDAADVAARRTSALAAASKAYADAHGHPLTHPRAGEGQRRGAPRRWAVPVRLALTAALALGLVGGAVALRSVSVASAGAVAIELPPVGVSLSAPSPGTDEADGAASPGVAATEKPSATEVSAPSVGGVVVVHVVGEVASPGVVELPAGSRVDDAIRAAGGATARADLAALNLARVVVDGEQVVVPAPGDDPGPQAGGGAADRAGVSTVGAGGSSPGTVDLNEADAAALDALPGIGPVLAGRIVDWRQVNGRFTSVDQLGEVDGIGPALLAKVRPRVRV